MFRESTDTTLDPKLEQLYAEVSRDVFGPPPKTFTNSTSPPSNNALMRLAARWPNASPATPPLSRLKASARPSPVLTAAASRPGRCNHVPF